MIPEKSMNEFFNFITNSKFDALVSSQCEMFVQSLYNYHPKTPQDIKQAFQTLNEIFTQPTRSQFPQIAAKVKELEDAATAQMQTVASRQISQKPKDGGNIELPGAAEEGVGVLCTLNDPVHAPLIDALTAWKFTCRRFPENGHSVLRAIATWLYQVCPHDEIRKRILLIGKELAKSVILKGQPVEEVLRSVTSFEKGRTLTKTQSDAVVLFLRFAAASSVIKKVDEGFICLNNGETKEAYIQRMCSMSGKQENQVGEMEICWLMNFLQVPYLTISFKPTQEQAALAVQPVAEFLEKGITSNLQGAIDQFQHIRLPMFARRVDEIRNLSSTPEAKQKAAQLVQEVEKYLSAQRNSQVDALQEKMKQLGKNALILGVGKDGSYSLLIQHR